MTFSVDSNANTSNPPAGFKSSINYLATQIQRLIGGTNWYSAPGFSLSQLSNNWNVVSGNTTLTPNTNILLAANSLQLTFPPSLNIGDSITLVPPANQVVQCALNFNGYNFNSYGVNGLLGYLTITQPYTFVYAGEQMGITPLLTNPQVTFNTVGSTPPVSTAPVYLSGSIFSSTPLDGNHIAANAFDNDLTTVFASSQIPAYIGMQLASAAQLQFFRFMPSVLDKYSGNTFVNALQGSALQGWNGQQWNTLYTLEANDMPKSGAMGQININSVNSYSKYQLTNDDVIGVANLEFWGNYTS